MADTVKIPRPRFPRRKQGSSGRVEHDDRGNATWVRSRATDAAEVAVNPELALIDEPAPSAVPVKGAPRRGHST